MTGRTRTHDGKTYTLSAAHPAADLFPWLEGDELQAFADDIRESGQKEKIKRHKGLIVDGRNRELACLIAGVRPKYEDLPADLTEERILRGITSANLKRRHLSASQRAMIAAGLETLKHGGKRKGQDQDVTGHLETTRAQVAAQLNVSPSSVARAAKVKADAPELEPAVQSGKLPVSLAAKATDLDPEDREEIAESEEPAEEARHRLNGTLPRPSIDASKPGGSRRNRNSGQPVVDPNHPFAKLLHKFSAWSGEITKALKLPEVGTELLWTLADLANMTMKVRFVVCTSGESALDNGSARATTGKFVGFYPLRQIVKLVGKRRKRLTRKMIQKTFLEALNASEQDMLDSEVWE